MLNVQTYIYDGDAEETKFVPLKDYQFPNYDDEQAERIRAYVSSN